MKWDKSACLILHVAVLSHADVQGQDGVDWPFLLALVKEARRRSSLQAQLMVAFAPSWCMGLHSPSPQSYKAWFVYIKVHACSRWYFRELESPGLPYQVPALRGAHACWRLRLMGENRPYCLSCVSLCPQIHLAWLGFNHLFQQDDASALGLIRAGDGVQRCSRLSRPPPSCWAHWAALCLPAWSVYLGDHCSVYISTHWRGTFYESKYVGEREKGLTAALSSQRSQPPATTLAAQKQKRTATASFLRDHCFTDIWALFCLLSLFLLFPEDADRAVFHLIFGICRFIQTHFPLFETPQLASSTPLYLNICFQ